MSLSPATDSRTANSRRTTATDSSPGRTGRTADGVRRPDGTATRCTAEFAESTARSAPGGPQSAPRGAVRRRTNGKLVSVVYFVERLFTSVGGQFIDYLCYWL